MNSEVIEICRLNSLNIKVSEKINPKFIKDFVLTSLQNNGYILSQNSKVFYTYLDKINEYQISYFKSSQIDYIPIIELIPIETDKSTLVLSGNFFAIFINKQVYYFQKIESLMSLPEFKAYAEAKLKIKIEHTKFISDEELDTLKKTHAQSHLNYVQSESFKSVKYYLMYLCFVGVILFSFLEFFTQNKVQTQHADELNFLQQQYNNLIINKKIPTATSHKLLALFNSISGHHLRLKYIKINGENCYVKLSCVNKKNVYSFVKKYQSNILVQSIQFDKNEVSYVLDANIKLYE